MALWYFLPRNRLAGPDVVARELHQHLTALLPDQGIEWKTICEDDADVSRLSLSCGPVPWRDAMVRLASERPVLHIPRSPLLAPNRRHGLFRRAVRLGIPVLSNIHGDPRTECLFAIKNREWGKAIGLLPSVLRWNGILQDHAALVVNSYRMRAQIESALEPRRVEAFVIPNGIDARWLDESSVVTPDRPRISTHGRIAQEKGIWALLGAIEQIRASLEPFQLLVVGDGPLRRTAIRWARSRALDGILQFPGRLARDDLVSILRSSAGCLYPATYDPFSLAALEAFACAGGPVHLSEEVGLLEFLGNEIDPRQTFPPSVAGAKEALERIIEGGEQGLLMQTQRSLASRFLWPRIAAEYLRIYRSLGA